MAFFRPSPLRLAGFGVAAGIVAFAGCSSSGSSPIAVSHPTMIRVEPEDFTGPVPCDLNGPGLKRYVATIVDRNYGDGGAPGSNDLGEAGATVEGDAQGFQAPSSLPTPCTTGSGFGFVVPGRHYEVLIDGYDTTELAPRAVGSREMVRTDVETDPVHTPVLTPRWHAKCARAIAVDSTLVRADRCEPFALDGDAATGELRLALGSLLGSLSCGAGAGAVDHFEIVEGGDDGEPTTRSVPCSEDAQAAITGPAGKRLTVVVNAVGRASADDLEATEVLAGAQCNGVLRGGASVDASCTALSNVTTLQVDVAAALVQLGVTCSATDISSVTVTPRIEGAAPRTLTPPDCLRPLTFGFGPAVLPRVTVSATFLSDDALHEAICYADPSPGQLVASTCDLLTE